MELEKLSELSKTGEPSEPFHGESWLGGVQGVWGGHGPVTPAAPGRQRARA